LCLFPHALSTENHAEVFSSTNSACFASQLTDQDPSIGLIPLRYRASCKLTFTDHLIYAYRPYVTAGSMMSTARSGGEWHSARTLESCDDAADEVVMTALGLQREAAAMKNRAKSVLG
jgi:hypothetical protein